VGGEDDDRAGGPFGALLRRHRVAAGLTQEALAERAGVSARAVSDLERGLYRAPHRDTVARLSAALELAGKEAAALGAAVERRRGPPPNTPAGRETAPNGNLPASLTSFVGRERELTELLPLLTRARLLTLVGPGGVGKTRLALELARRSAAAYAGGAWFVDLTPLADGGLVPPAALAALGWPDESPGRPPLEGLVERLRGRAHLLVLDNCEHVIDGCARFAHALLRSCPRLTILATSREPLGVSGEMRWRVPSLSLPGAGEPRGVDELIRYEAIRLFAERARLVRADFAVTAANAAAVQEVCRHLDGIPLALELAAARVRVLPVEQIAARLDDRFRLLTGGGRTALPRHQTLKALVDWSHDLLADAERSLLRRLAVFSGGWALDAAEAVCAGDPLERHAVLDVLTALVDRSLVQAEAQEGDERYRLLETVRQYAGEKLLAAGEAATVRVRHRDWYLALAERAAPELTTPRQGRWYRRLAADHDNLRAAIGYCRTDPDGAEAELRLVAAMAHFWRVRGYPREGRERLASALQRAPRAATRARALALAWSGHLAHTLDEPGQGRALGEEAVRVAHELGDPRVLAFALRTLGTTLAFGLGLTDQGQAVLEQGLATARGCRDLWDAAVGLLDLGLLAHALGDPGRSRELLEEGLALSREAGDGVAVGHVLCALGQLALRRGEVEAARERFDEALAISLPIDERVARDLALCGLGDVARLAGDDRAARDRYRECLRLASDTGSGRGDVNRFVVRIAGAETRLGRPDRAARLFGSLAGWWREDSQRQLHAPTGVAQDLADTRAALGDAAFEAAFAAGKAMAPQRVVAYAAGDEAHGSGERRPVARPEPLEGRTGGNDAS
jgi:predicted ATPase/DNA-binding XRE family transcriptional regulator